MKKLFLRIIATFLDSNTAQKIYCDTYGHVWSDTRYCCVCKEKEIVTPKPIPTPTPVEDISKYNLTLVCNPLEVHAFTQSIWPDENSEVHLYIGNSATYLNCGLVREKFSKTFQVTITWDQSAVLYAPLKFTIMARGKMLMATFEKLVSQVVEVK